MKSSGADTCTISLESSKKYTKRESWQRGRKICTLKNKTRCQVDLGLVWPPSWISRWPPHEIQDGGHIGPKLAWHLVSIVKAYDFLPLWIISCFVYFLLNRYTILHHYKWVYNIQRYQMFCMIIQRS